MKKAFLAFALTVLSLSAHADLRCTTFGSTTTCHGYDNQGNNINSYSNSYGNTTRTTINSYGNGQRESFNRTCTTNRYGNTSTTNCY